MNKIIESLELLGIVPVVVIEDASHADRVAQALINGGVQCMEVTFRTEAARSVLENIAHSHPEMILGAGTILTVQQVKEAVEAGAKFIVSPGTNKKVVEHCLSQNIPVIPGVATPSEVEGALEMGLDVLKFFPAEALGGVEYLKAMSAPYRRVRFMPTGGINQTNLLSYLKLRNVIACGGSWMVSPELIAAQRFDEIQRLTQEGVGVILGFKLTHVGINCGDEPAAKASAAMLAQLLNFPIRDGSSSTFVGAVFEFTKKQSHGAHGHIAIGTNFIHRAIAYLERRGCPVRPETKVEKDGRLVAVYLDVEFSGFAVHLFQI